MSVKVNLQNIKKWKLYKRLEKESRDIENVNAGTMRRVLKKSDENNIETFLYIIMYYEVLNKNKKILTGRFMIAGKKFCLNVGDFPKPLLKILFLFCTECGIE